MMKNNLSFPQKRPTQVLVDEAGVNDHRDDDEESEAVAPFDAAALVFTAVGEVDDGGDEERVEDEDEDQDGEAVDGRLILGI